MKIDDCHIFARWRLLVALSIDRQQLFFDRDGQADEF